MKRSPGYVEAEQFDFPFMREFSRPIPSPEREERKKQWRGRAKYGRHPLAAIFGYLATGTAEGMAWLVNASAYYPRGVWERVPDPFDIPWPEVVMILEKAKAVAPRLNPAALQTWQSSIISKIHEDFSCGHASACIKVTP